MITINTRDPRPIYVQIKEALCRLILTGALQTNERLPSVREMAAQLAINPNTIQRAYRELEHEGFIYSMTGNTSRIDARRDQFREAARELLHLGVTKQSLIGILDALEQEDSHA